MDTTAQSKPSEPSPPRGYRALALLLAAIVFLSGASVMIYQFMVVRILTRDFGGALDVWAAVIAVCLAGISLGYYLGGRVADRYNSWSALGLALLLGGVTGCLIEPLALGAGGYLRGVQFALNWHPYAAAFASSFIPNLALGTILPQAIKLHTRQLEKLGSSAGRIAAMSEIGSIFGVVLTAQVLVRYVGVQNALYGTAITLMAAGLLLIGARRLFPALAALALLAAPGVSQAQNNIVFQDYSAYHHIIVEDTNTHRLLRFNRDIQSTMLLRNPYAGGFEYTDFFHIPMVFNPTIDRVLFIGLGGGTGPKDFLQYYPNVQIETAEIDPMVVNVARRYFYLPDHERHRIVQQDGRTHLSRSGEKYGAIVMDAYASGGPYGAYLPYHLATQEFFELCWDRLENGGALVFNAIGSHGGMNAHVIRDVNATLNHVFPAVYVFQAGTSINTVFVAIKVDYSELDDDGLVDGAVWPDGPWMNHRLSGGQLRNLVEQLRDDGFLRKPNMEQRAAQFSRAHRMGAQGNILTDDYAPVDVGRR